MSSNSPLARLLRDHAVMAVRSAIDPIASEASQLSSREAVAIALVQTAIAVTGSAEIVQQILRSESSNENANPNP